MFLKKITLMREKIASFAEFPFTIPILKEFTELPLTENVTFFVGENGSGKSTLLEAVADKAGLSKAGGSQHNYINIPHTVSSLSEYIRLSWLPKVTNGFFLRAETFYDFASYLDVLQEENIGIDVFKSYGGNSLHKQSHGESFLSLFQHRLGGKTKSIYLLDEPEAALSPTSQLTLSHS